MWLSNRIQFSTEIEDSNVLVGLKDASIRVDLSKLQQSDKKNGTSFITGGRAYFEAEVVGYKISSFTSRGMLDELGY